MGLSGGVVWWVCGGGGVVGGGVVGRQGWGWLWRSCLGGQGADEVLCHARLPIPSATCSLPLPLPHCRFPLPECPFPLPLPLPLPVPCLLPGFTGAGAGGDCGGGAERDCRRRPGGLPGSGAAAPGGGRAAGGWASGDAGGVVVCPAVCALRPELGWGRGGGGVLASPPLLHASMACLPSQVIKRGITEVADIVVVSGVSRSSSTAWGASCTSGGGISSPLPPLPPSAPPPPTPLHHTRRSTRRTAPASWPPPVLPRPSDPRCTSTASGGATGRPRC